MSNNEICREFCEAKKPALQIEILSDLELKNVLEICETLYKNGLLDKRAGKYRNIYLALKMTKEGYKAWEIAEKLGIKKSYVNYLRNKYKDDMGFIHIEKKPEEKKVKSVVSGGKAAGREEMLEKELKDALEIIDILKKEIYRLKNGKLEKVV